MKPVLVKSETLGVILLLPACLCSRRWSSLGTWLSVCACKVAARHPVAAGGSKVLHVSLLSALWLGLLQLHSSCAHLPAAAQ